MSGSNCCFLTCIQLSQEVVRWSGSPISLWIFQFMIHTVRGFSIVNDSEVDVFLKFPCFFFDLTDVGSLISGSSAFSKSNLNILKFLFHILLKPSLKDFKHYLTSIWDECCCGVVWAFFGIALLWDWNENWPFCSPVSTAQFSKFAGILSWALAQHYLLGFEITQLEFHHLHYFVLRDAS